ncbi:hypothetical protein CHISP_1281 [Chitinispirillum alkaliphilum]|nr:hypothetical protein CHISP_1281 [Chitinispirillum alkaliphilum]
MEEFTKHVFQCEHVRVVPFITMIEWMQDPVPSDLYVAPTIARRNDETSVIAKTAEITKTVPSITVSGRNISVTVSVSDHYIIDLYTVSGRRVTSLHEGILQQGNHSFDLRERNLSNGVYMARISGRNGISSTLLPIN